MDSLTKEIYSLHSLERKVLPYVTLKKEEILAKSGLLEGELQTAVLMLEAKKLISVERVEFKEVVLDKLGEKFVSSVFPEVSFLKAILSSPKKMSQIPLEKEEISASLGILKKEGLVDIKNDGELVFSAKLPKAKEFVEGFKNPLKFYEKGVRLESLDVERKKEFEGLKSRKFLREQVRKDLVVSLSSQGKKIADLLLGKFKDLDLIEGLDLNLIKSKAWKGKEFRHYDVNVDVPMPEIGRRHPMLEANSILKEVFIEMGFKEMEGPMVEMAFWNMDVMWIPQDHPARDEQDTFYLEGQGKLPKEFALKVKKMHEEGIKRTHTTKGDWSEKISSRRLLRTHSTATTFRTLAELGKRFAKGENIDGKYFYVANNFRNEAVDATHLAEFYQAEGFIIGDDLSLADLMGFVKEYYAKLGITKISFKPTFNPYTEPSMEAHYYDERMGKWYALINSGIFRQETLVPLGLSGKTIIAWGMGASRVATLLSGKSSMREITGATCDFEWLKERPMMNRKIVRGGN